MYSLFVVSRSHCVYFLSFLLSGCGHHRERHPFPTRRSSDLCTAPTMSRASGARLHEVRLEGEHQREPEARDIVGAVRRSEEHTSELQSHHDLVCRLLLEKKNIERIPTPCAIQTVLNLFVLGT